MHRSKWHHHSITSSAQNSEIALGHLRSASARAKNASGILTYLLCTLQVNSQLELRGLLYG
jgi:hypothetical protein